MNTADIKNRFEYAARIGGYRVEEWLLPALNGAGLRVAATMTIKGKLYGLGFRWDGNKSNDLADRVIALDYAMSKVPALVEKGKGPIWHKHEEPLFGMLQ